MLSNQVKFSGKGHQDQRSTSQIVLDKVTVTVAGTSVVKLKV